MKVVILAGGLGTRLSEYTKTIPKPMVKVNGLPILVYIMNHYIKFGFNDFIIAAGYKGIVIKKYFETNNIRAKIKVINTGLKTMTGGRLKRLKKYLNKERFLLTYGDGISNIKINKLISFHKKNKFICTLTAVRPPARFGAIKLKGKKVFYFKEKSSLDEGWINWGYFVFEPEIFKFLKNDKTLLEKDPMEKLSRKRKLGAFKHYDFWQCMDTARDKEILEKSLKKIKL